MKSAWDRLLDWLKSSMPDEKLPKELEDDFTSWTAEPVDKHPIALVVRHKDKEVKIPAVDIPVYPNKLKALVSTYEKKARKKNAALKKKKKDNGRPYYK